MEPSHPTLEEVVEQWKSLRHAAARRKSLLERELRRVIEFGREKGVDITWYRSPFEMDIQMCNEHLAQLDAYLTKYAGIRQCTAPGASTVPAASGPTQSAAAGEPSRLDQLDTPQQHSVAAAEQKPSDCRQENSVSTLEEEDSLDSSESEEIQPLLPASTSASGSGAAVHPSLRYRTPRPGTGTE